MKTKLLKENLIKAALFASAVSSIVIVFFIVSYMAYGGSNIFINWIEHGFTGPLYNMIPYMFNSVYIALGGTILGVIIGLPCAIYLAEFADMRIRNIVKPTIEMLNGFPSVIIGLLGFTLLVKQPLSFGITPALGIHGEGNMLFGWIVLGIMALPIITSISEDSIRAVPQELREASLGLGATKWQTTIEILIPGAMSGVLTSILLALASGIGETMAVLSVIGIVVPPPLTLNPLMQSNSLTTLIATSVGDAGNQLSNVRFQVLLAAGMILFIMTTIIVLLVRVIISQRGKVNVGRPK